MYKVKIFSIGKIKEPWLKIAIEEYTRRLSPILSIKWCLAKTDASLEKSLDNERYVALSPEGKMFSSVDFSPFLIDTLSKEKARLSFVIGGATGLSDTVIKRSITTISLSKMTFTHQMTRLILIEQIYRAFEIDKGSDYHK